MLQHKGLISVILELPERVSGETADLFIRNVREQIDVSSINQIVIDCSDMKHFTSAHIKLVYHADKLCREANVYMQLKMGMKGLVDPVKVLSKDDYWAASMTIGQSGDTNTLSEKARGSESFYCDELEPTESAVERACLQFDEHLQTFELDSQTHYSIRTLYYEMLNNIQLHSRMNPNESVSAEVVVNDTAITMTFTHGGLHFDLNEQMTGPHECSYSDEERLSFGIFMIKKLTDEIKYERTEEEKNITTLIYRRDNK